MKLREIAYTQRARAQAIADEWAAGFPHLHVILDWRSSDNKYRVRVENKRTGKIGYLSAGRA